ncbi:hypothetical protein [Mobilitalea sibirica]|uniref:hypothetical protein n=1 Tax=Mobilitalea sibirica TaxID=1462919 RepID=UPI0018D42F97|nr:hypothetical protein [Mobilitalea sibirica]
MKLSEIQVNTLIELHFLFNDERHRLCLGLLYKINNSVYISAIKNAGKTMRIPVWRSHYSGGW